MGWSPMWSTFSQLLPGAHFSASGGGLNPFKGVLCLTLASIALTSEVPWRAVSHCPILSWFSPVHVTCPTLHWGVVSWKCTPDRVLQATHAGTLPRLLSSSTTAPPGHSILPGDSGFIRPSRISGGLSSWVRQPVAPSPKVRSPGRDNCLRHWFNTITKKEDHLWRNCQLQRRWASWLEELTWSTRINLSLDNPEAYLNWRALKKRFRIVKSNLGMKMEYLIGMRKITKIMYF